MRSLLLFFLRCTHPDHHSDRAVHALIFRGLCLCRFCLWQKRLFVGGQIRRRLSVSQSAY